MEQRDSSSDEDVSVEDKDESLPVNEGNNEFAETIRLIEANADEVDHQVTDSISEVEGSKDFPCQFCPKVCKSKGGLTRHSRSKHVGAEAAATDIPPITLEIVAKMIDEIALKLREENLYPKDILSVVSSIKPSEQFIGFVNKVFAQFCRKHNQDALLTTFYGDMVKEWKSFFLPCQDQKAINLLLIHFPQKLVGHYKLGSIQDIANFQENEEISLSPEEVGPLSYVTGYVLQSLYRKSKNSPHWNSARSQELQSLLQSMKVEDSEDEYIQSLSRGGLWTPNDTIKDIANKTEITFRKHLHSKKGIHVSVPTDDVVEEVLAMPAVKSLWENIILNVDSPLTNECSKLTLENFIKLYVRVRSFSYAKDIVNKYKLKEKASKTKALRTELKNKSS